MSANLTPYGSIRFGKPHFATEFGNFATIKSDLVLFVDLRDSTGPIATPAGVLVPKRFAVPLPSGEFALPPDTHVVATWNGGGTQIADFTLNNASFALGRVVGAREAPETSAFSHLYMVEAIIPDSGGNYTAGELYVFPRSSLFFFDENHVFMGTALLDDPFAALPVAVSNGGW